MGVLGLIASFIFWRTLPPSRHFSPRPLRVGALLTTFWEQLRDVHLVALYAEGFLIMGAFVTSYNYITYHLLAPPYSLSHAAVGFIFVVYLVGIFASAWIGARAGRAGRRRMLSLNASRGDAGRHRSHHATALGVDHPRDRGGDVRVLWRPFGGE